MLYRGTAAAAAAILITGLLLAPSAPAQAGHTEAKDNAVRSGDARFEVLSPTLIRTEYQKDGKFTDAGTFNVVGRDDFPRTHFTKRTDHGWLTIDTGQMTLRYKVGSGTFTADNLTVQLNAGRQKVQAQPWAGHSAPDCALGTLCEAESLQLSGPGVATDHSGYTGRGFAAGWQSTGDNAKFAVTVPETTTKQLTVRYANSAGGDGQTVARTLTVQVDGDTASDTGSNKAGATGSNKADATGSDTGGATGQTLTLPTTANWDTWGLASLPIDLTAGRHEISLVRGPNDSGNVNVDSLALVNPGDPFPPAATPQPQPLPFGTVGAAETGALTGGAKQANDHNGAEGTGFLAGLESTTSADALTVTGVPTTGNYQVQIRYANGQGSNRTMAVNGTTVTLPPTSGWDYWNTVSTKVHLTKGTNTVTLACPTGTSCQVNVDTVAVTSPNAPILAPHAALGGYRRGLDGVDGSAPTYPGLLYQDGWSLLDDSASALIENHKLQDTKPRPDTEQDGYVFAYGQNFTKGLSDLSTLTGPTKLLPKWTYGTWYSEYYDRTATDFENIVTRAKAENVPLDALVVDTDVKAPDKWNGWTLDPTRIPDPTAFFAWAKQQGLHTGINIHPSILGSDPKFAQAQKTAKGKLQRVGCNGGADCYAFDWGDPDQLKAYMQLHDEMAPSSFNGPDFWWLDWCCDSSKSSLAGVTPDAWINQQYADKDGFAFSRAYGSLQAGGYGSPTPVATGPWADKRTTLHFTGDTTSDWQTLQMEVGYTPGESAATGLAAISHDIGGHTNGLQQPGSEPGSTKLPDDLYARWVQFGTFQPIDRLHSNHSDRLPWQYGPAADASATKFLNLREQLLPYTYAAAQQATRTGTPIVRSMYLAYPDEQAAYATAGSEYLYGPDYLVAPVTTPGTTATTPVWFPPGNSWTDIFTGKTYRGGTTQNITTTLDTMPVFKKH